MDRVASAVAVALGSNLGDRRGHLAFAVEALARFLANLRCSQIIETDPVGVPDEQPPFLNAAVVGETLLSPHELLERLQAIERLRGRERPFRAAPRTLDLDLILFDDVVLESPGLTVPHPRFRDRQFVLEPLAEVAGTWRDPVTGRSVAELLGLVTGGEV